MEQPSSTLSGYDTNDQFLATRHTQGGRVVYSLVLPLATIAGGLLPRPDPSKPAPGNRRVKPGHAQGFAKYVREISNWTAPSLMLRAPDIFEFERQQSIGGIQFGILSIPRTARDDIRIIDGQHRILGIYLASQDIADELAKQRELIAAAERDSNLQLVQQLSAKRETLEAQRRRLAAECIAAEIHLTDDPKSYMQMFDDVADNAVGITASLRARFDNRKIVNRVLDDVLKHKLLGDYVDLEQDRITSTSERWIGAKHVADITRTLAVGINGRIGARQENDLSEAELVEKTHNFFEGLADAFPDLAAVADASLTPQQLRARSLLGSATMIRALAGAWFELLSDYDEDGIVELFSSLAPIMGSPLAPGSPWVAGDLADAFYLNSAGQYTSPNAHRGVDKKLVAAIVRWGRTRPAWLKSAA